MSPSTPIQAHIAYELMDEPNPDVVLIEFLSREIIGPGQAAEFRRQLDSLVRPELPHRFVMDFGKVRCLGSSAFSEIGSFARQVGRLAVCNMHHDLRLGADLVGLERYADFADNRQAAVAQVRRGELHGAEDTGDYPALQPESGDASQPMPAAGPNRTSDSQRPKASRSSPDEDTDEKRDPRTRAMWSSPRTMTLGAALTVEDFGGRSDALGG
jgi:hypothetical protein